MHTLLEVDKVVKQRKFFERGESDIKLSNLVHPLKSLRSIIHVNEDINTDSNNIFWDELFTPKQGVLLDLNINAGAGDDSFHRAMGTVQILGQCFGIMPVVGVLGKNASCLRFEWVSWRMGYCLLFMAGAFFLSVLSFIFMLHVGFSVDNAGMLVFYGSCFTVQVLFLRLSLRWADLGQEISRVEAISAQTPRPRNLPTGFFSLRTRFNCCAFVVLFLALVEHALCILAGVSYAYCDKLNTVVKSHYITAFPQVFWWTEYAHWKASILQIINLSATFVWNFMDLFIILLSLGLSNSFENLNKILYSVMGKNFSENFWRSARNEYAHMSQLVKKVDDAINQIVLLSFTQNLYIICRQLFHTLRSRNNDNPDACEKSKEALISGLAGPIYFMFSFSFLVCRFLAVALYASRLHVASRLPLAALYYVTPKFYSIEVQRFLDQVTTETIALTGLNCFYITRNLILTIAGTVVTYELVMMQFNMPKTASINCNNQHI